MVVFVHGGTNLLGYGGRCIGEILYMTRVHLTIIQGVPEQTTALLLITPESGKRFH